MRYLADQLENETQFGEKNAKGSIIRAWCRGHTLSSKELGASLVEEPVRDTMKTPSMPSGKLKSALPLWLSQNFTLSAATVTSRWPSGWKATGRPQLRGY
jgi:hypothetical protein